MFWILEKKRVIKENIFKIGHVIKWNLFFLKKGNIDSRVEKFLTVYNFKHSEKQFNIINGC